MQFVFHENELGALFFGELEHWNSSRLSKNFRNQSLVNDSADLNVAGSELLGKFHALSVHALLFVAL